MVKKILLLTFLTFLIAAPGYCYTWVQLTPEDNNLWYDPTTIEIDKPIGSVLIKSYFVEDKSYIMAWVIIDCKEKKYYIVGALAVDENDKAISPPDGRDVSGQISKGGPKMKIFYNMLCGAEQD